jgi:two-component system, NtrC family, response regulator AtoC
VTTRRVLVVDDEELIRWSLTERLRIDGHDVVEAATAAAALDRAADGVDLVLLDYTLPDGDGLAVLRRLRDIDPDTIVIMLTAHRDVELVVESMKAGAFDYATKPFDLDDIALRVTRALETTRTRRELRILREGLGRPYSLASIIGSSEPMQKVKALVTRIAASPGSTVLITGESGSGKDLIAKVIHYNSARAARPYTNITSSALPEMLMESELFGHERGAFTDARQQKRGLFEQSDGGTVFLDEIGEMAPILQAKLLRFLEERAFRRVGGNADIQVDVRVIAATNRNLEDAVKQGKFRQDLFYRLNVLRVEVPPLRVRTDDVLLLAQYFIEAFSKEFRRPVRGLSAQAEKALLAYSWPGNVREMRNLVERAVLLAEDQVLQPSDFDSLHTAHPGTGDTRVFSVPASGLNLEDVEKQFVVQALERAGGNQTKAAALLGLHRDQIRYRIEKFGLARK